MLLLLVYSIVYSMLLLIKTLPAGKQSLLLSFKTQVILLKTFPNEMRCILYCVAKMNILTKFREIRESRQNIFNSEKVFAIISLLFLFPRQLSRQKSFSYKYFCEIFKEQKIVAKIWQNLMPSNYFHENGTLLSHVADKSCFFY